MKTGILSLVLLLMAVDITLGARILGLFPFPAPSHLIIQTALMKELASRGHQVTVLSPFPLKKPVANYTDIVIEKNITDIGKSNVPSNLFEMKNLNFLQMMIMMWFMGESTCDVTLSDKASQQLINSKDQHFDLIVVEAFDNECYLGFAHKFKAPIVQVCPYGGSNAMFDWVGNPSPYSYVPDDFLNFGDRMNFLERLINTIVGTIKTLGRRFIHLPMQDSVMRKYFGPDVPPLAELETSTSLLLVNSHFSINYPRPLVPNLVQVGGLHVQPPKKLPKDLQDYLDNAPHGVIYFSMGSNLRSAQMPKEKRDALLQAFASFKQKVLWKWEEETLPNQPQNVKIGKWLPQSDILAHPNVRLFITHGGLLSTQEAIIRGVPLVGIPIFGDQSLNMARAVTAGYGILLEFQNITKESVTWAVQEIMNNPMYRNNVQSRSRIFKDQPMTPMETAVYWTEYVLRHKGAHHMRSAALDLYWFQYHLLDVIAFLSAIGIALLLIIFLITRAVYRKICGAARPATGAVSAKKKRS